MPVEEGPNTVTVGTICYGCALYQTKECPYGNHNKTSAMDFKGDIRGKCNFYQPVYELLAQGNGKMQKLAASEMNDSQLNVELYRKVMAMSDEDRGKVFNYWKILFPEDYAEDMADDDIDSGQKGVDKGNSTTKREKDKKDGENKKQEKQEKKQKQEMDELSTKSWYKK